jgi:hypothetical protein
MISKTPPSSLRVYMQPRLIVYGTASSLTAAGSKTGQENQGNAQGTMA